MSSEKLPDKHASDNEERVEVEQVETTTALYRPEVDTSGIDEKKLLRKLDWTLIPWLSFLYLLSFLDRSSIGNAKVFLLNMHARGPTLMDAKVVRTGRRPRS